MEKTAEKERGLSKVREGHVVSSKMEKTVVVNVVTQKKHPQYQKYIRKSKRYMAHDEQNQCQPGDLVRIIESRPLSKNKRWRVQAIVEKAL